MSYLLDTTILIDLLRQKQSAWEFIDGHEKDQIFTSSICEAEVWEGVHREKENFIKRKEALEKLLSSFYEILNCDSESALIAGKIRANLGVKGEMIGDMDILIAATALNHNCILVTKNPKHFQRVPDLQVENV